MYLSLQDLADELDVLRSIVNDHETGEHDADEAEAASPIDKECPLCCPDDDPGDRFKALVELESDTFYGDIATHACEAGPAIDEADFAEYAEELATDLGIIGSNGSYSWPFTRIDWDAAADDLKADYTSFEWEGTTYLVRSI